MKKPLFLVWAGCFAFLFASSGSLRAQEAGAAPHIEQRGATRQLIVNGEPMLMIAGELYNSSSSSLEYMQPEWKQLADMGLNTVLTPVSWELVEPEEGKYDFALVDGLLAQAREQHMHIVFLWLAAWKNGKSGYPPVWVKRDTARFPRAMQAGQPMSILSTFSPALREADARAFRALMEHLHSVDGQAHTVLMMQVENEVGVLGASRDHSPVADRAFAGTVPAPLTAYLSKHHDTLNPELRTLWEANGARTSGTWTEIFGDSARTDELFMAWQYAHYVQSIASAGKAAYPLPMYANAWLGGDDTPPGNYPSGGPQPRVLDVWKAAGDGLDMESPDLYASGFADWCTRYHRPDNPLFIPETNGSSAGAQNVFYAVGEQAAMGFSPFAIDAGLHNEGMGGFGDESAYAKGKLELTRSYHALQQIMPQVLEAQQRGEIHGFVLDKAHPQVDFVMKGVTLHVSLDEVFGYHAENGYGLILQDGPLSFLGAGKGFRVTLTPRNDQAPHLGIASVDEGQFSDGQWHAGRRLNGDENDQGDVWRFDSREVHIERARFYEYK